MFPPFLPGFTNYTAIFEQQAVSKIKQIFELFIQCNTKNQRQFRCGIELTCFDGTDRVPRHADHIRQLLL